MRLKIKSDGTSKGTLVTDERGRVLDGVVKAEWSMEAGDQPVPLVKLTLIGVGVDIQDKNGGVKFLKQ